MEMGSDPRRQQVVPFARWSLRCGQSWKHESRCSARDASGSVFAVSSGAQFVPSRRVWHGTTRPEAVVSTRNRGVFTSRGTGLGGTGHNRPNRSTFGSPTNRAQVVRSLSSSGIGFTILRVYNAVRPNSTSHRVPRVRRHRSRGRPQLRPSDRTRWDSCLSKFVERPPGPQHVVHRSTVLAGGGHCHPSPFFEWLVADVGEISYI